MTGKRIGYIRVSTIDQNIDRQLVDIPLDKKFIEFASGKNKHRPQLESLLEYIREDDQLFVHSTDRLARSIKDLVELVDTLNKKKVTIHFVQDALTFSGDDSPTSKFQLHILGAVAELERSILLERQREGIAQAKRMGKYKGRRTKLTDDLISKIETAMTTRQPKTKIAESLSISTKSLYQYIKIIENRQKPAA